MIFVFDGYAVMVFFGLTSILMLVFVVYEFFESFLDDVVEADAACY